MTAFAPSKRKGNGNHCRDCTRLYRQEWKGTTAGREQKAADRARVADRNRAVVRQEKLARGACVDCFLGVTAGNLVAFDFDHRDRSTKSAPVSELVTRGKSLRRLLAEIAKCDLRCANCHRIKTWREHEHYEREVTVRVVVETLF